MTTKPTADAFRLAYRLFRARSGKQVHAWLELADALVSHDPETRHEAPEVFFAQRISYERNLHFPGRSDLHRITWALAAELLEAEPTTPNARILPFDQLVTHDCPTCGAEAIVVGKNTFGADPEGGPAYGTDVYALCLQEPHRDRIGILGPWNAPIPD